MEADTGEVALRKESVDRNVNLTVPLILPLSSLSARRAWIEICRACRSGWLLAVALRKESVDRNIKEDVSYNIKETVALRKESVDRNLIGCVDRTINISRSPQGERG